MFYIYTYIYIYIYIYNLLLFVYRTQLKYMDSSRLKPVAHKRKQLSKWPGKAVCTAVSSRVQRRFRENFATQDREENICHVRYFWLPKADSSPCAVNVWIELSVINQLANETGLLAQVISKLKMAEISKFWTWVQDGGRRQAERQDGTNCTFSSSFSSKNPSQEI